MTRLEYYRRSRGMTLRALASEVRCSAKTLGDVEKGRITGQGLHPAIGRLIELWAGATLEWLLGGCPIESPPVGCKVDAPNKCRCADHK